MQIVWIIIVVVVGLFASMTLYVSLSQAKYVYYPSPSIAATPQSVGLGFDQLDIETHDGETLKAWFVPCKKQAPENALTILFCHGNAGNIGDRLTWLQTFNRLGYNCLIFDYRGYGESSGSPSEAGTYSDARACWDYLVDQRGTPPGRIAVFGHSLGGAIASQLAANTRPAVLVLESVFASAPEMAKRMFPFLPIGMFCRFSYDNVAHVADVHCPVLVAHSKVDTTCPYDQGRLVFEAAPEPKQFVELQGGHNDGGLNSNPHYQVALVEFLKKHS